MRLGLLATFLTAVVTEGPCVPPAVGSQSRCWGPVVVHGVTAQRRAVSQQADPIRHLFGSSCTSVVLVALMPSALTLALQSRVGAAWAALPTAPRLSLGSRPRGAGPVSLGSSAGQPLAQAPPPGCLRLRPAPGLGRRRPGSTSGPAAPWALTVPSGILTLSPHSRRQRAGHRHDPAVHGARGGGRDAAEADGRGGRKRQQKAGDSMAGGHAQGTVGPALLLRALPTTLSQREARCLPTRGAPTGFSQAHAFISGHLAGCQASLRISGPVTPRGLDSPLGAAAPARRARTGATNPTRAGNATQVLGAYLVQYVHS